MDEPYSKIAEGIEGFNIHKTFHKNGILMNYSCQYCLDTATGHGEVISGKFYWNNPNGKEALDGG